MDGEVKFTGSDESLPIDKVIVVLLCDELISVSFVNKRELFVVAF